MTRVFDLLEAKGRDIWAVTPTDTVYDAIAMMSDKGVGALLVMEGKKLVGIVSERDYARQVILQGKSSKATPVGDIMTRKILCIPENRTMDECMALMTEKRIRHLPVVEGRTVVGVLSIGDVVKAVIADKQFMIEQLENYITQ